MYIIKETIIINNVLKDVFVFDECYTNKNEAMKRLTAFKRKIKNDNDLKECKDNKMILENNEVRILFNLQKLKTIKSKG